MQRILSGHAEFRVQAEFIVVDPKLILTNCQLLIRDGRIAELSETPQVQADLYLDNSTLMPGFINSHTHLDLSDLAEPFPAGASFPEWIAAVVGHRRHQLGSLQSAGFKRLRQQTIASGLRECLQMGTAALIDIVTFPWSMDQFSDAGGAGTDCDHDSTIVRRYPQIVALAEVLGLEHRRFQQTLAWARGLLKLADQADLGKPFSSLGISPHAPYSLIHPDAIVPLQQIQPQAIMAMHIAESLEEREWVESGEGPFREFYQRLGLPIDRPRMQIAEAIELLASRSRSLLIHGNYLLESELDRIAQSNITIVYCPRTHQHFRHRGYALRSMLEREIPVTLGTDSRASNPDLSIWRECCEARQLHSSYWSASQSLAAITTLPAHILGREQDLGSLHPGCEAFLNVVRTPIAATSESLLDQLIRPEGQHPQPLFPNGYGGMR